MSEIVDFVRYKENKELKVFSDNLYKQVVKLLEENHELQQKIIHLEELLKYSNIPTIR